MAESYPQEAQARRHHDTAADQRRSQVLVVDASAALAWVFDDERNEFATAILQQVSQRGAMVPCHWILEVTNGLLRADRHGRLRSREHPADILQRLGELPIDVDVETPVRAWRETFALAEACRLTIYDAAYLELALRLASPLVTLDMDLARAATAAGADVMAPS